MNSKTTYCYIQNNGESHQDNDELKKLNTKYYILHELIYEA